MQPEPAGIDRTVYGKPSGVLDFRLFPNPDFNEEARKKWNADRLMNAFERSVRPESKTPTFMILALTAVTPTRSLEIVSDYFPLLLRESLCPLTLT